MPFLTRLDGVVRQQQTRIAAHSVLGGLTGRVLVFTSITLYAFLGRSTNFVQFSALMIIIQAMTGVFASAVSGAAAAEASRQLNRTSPRHHVRQNLTMVVAITVVATILSPLMYELLLHEQPSWHVAVVGPAVGLSVLSDSLLGALSGLGLTRRVMWCEATRGALTAASALGFGLTMGPIAAVAGMAFSEAVVSWWAYISLPDQRFGAQDISGTTDRRVALAGILTNLVIQASILSQQSILSWAYGPTVLAAFSIANRFASFAILLPNLLTRNVIGLLGRAAHDQAAFDRVFRTYFLQVLVLTSLAAFATLPVARLLFNGVLDKYPPSGGFLVVLTLTTIPSALGSVLGTVCLVRRRLLLWVASDVGFLAVVPLWTLICSKTGSSPTAALSGLVLGYSVIALTRYVGIHHSAAVPLPEGN